MGADGEAHAIKLVNEAANQYFVGNAQLLKRVQMGEVSLMDNVRSMYHQELTW